MELSNLPSGVRMDFAVPVLAAVHSPATSHPTNLTSHFATDRPYREPVHSRCFNVHINYERQPASPAARSPLPSQMLGPLVYKKRFVLGAVEPLLLHSSLERLAHRWFLEVGVRVIT